MTDWPAGVRVAPLREWPGTLTPGNKRQRSNFSAPYSATLALLKRELVALHSRDIELLVAIPVGAFRRDGKPYANARAEHPGIVISFDSKHGHLSYPCDTFTTWPDNIRAVALALEALRKVDRYGVTAHGEQYRGFAAISATVVEPFTDAPSARRWLDSLWGVDGDSLGTVIRRAKRMTHPDSGPGDAYTFDYVMRAEALLRAAGML